MVDMRGWSFPIGRFLGVDVRIHTFFLLLLGLSISYASVAGATGGRGFVLWLLLLLAVVVREVARAVGAAWYGLDLRSILLLPTGGLFSYATSEATEKAETPEMQKRMAVIGPIANIGFGLLLQHRAEIIVARRIIRPQLDFPAYEPLGGCEVALLGRNDGKVAKRGGVDGIDFQHGGIKPLRIRERATALRRDGIF